MRTPLQQATSNFRDIGNRVKTRRKIALRSRQELADDAGVSIYYIHKLEAGNGRNLSVLHLAAVAKALKTTLDHLMWGT
jgi:transcriptional regulator with XRE-family HTH domain